MATTFLGGDGNSMRTIDANRSGELQYNLPLFLEEALTLVRTELGDTTNRCFCIYSHLLAT